MRTIYCTLFWAVWVIVIGCSNEEHNSLSLQTVEIDQKVPSPYRNASLSIAMYGSDSNRTHIFGTCNLKSPVGSGGVGEGTNWFWWTEERLIAIKIDGFVVRFTQRTNDIEQTISILFRYGEATQTNIPGWRIVGTFK